MSTGYFEFRSDLNYRDFLKLLDSLPGNGSFLATAAVFGVTVKENGHHPVSQSVMTCIF